MADGSAPHVALKFMDWETLLSNNIESFWVNIIAGSIFFVLGVLTSIWLIPKYTLRLIRKQNKRYLKQKLSFAIQEVCDFFNSMPHSFKPNDLSCAMYVSNLKYPKLDDFVALLKPDLFRPVAFEQMAVNLLQTIRDSDSEARHNLVESEILRMEKLRTSLENIVGIHSNSLENEIVNEISQLCLDIRIVVKNHLDDALFEELLKKKEGTFGASHLKVVYENAFSLLKRLVDEKGFSKRSIKSAIAD